MDPVGIDLVDLIECNGSHEDRLSGQVRERM
jgi:hypothetical protein